eukprot:3821245-Alexandrium_andersonii.AAC.1
MKSKAEEDEYVDEINEAEHEERRAGSLKPPPEPGENGQGRKHLDESIRAVLDTCLSGDPMCE